MTYSLIVNKRNLYGGQDEGSGCQMIGCKFWIRDKNGVAAFRCGDVSNNGIELCHKCKEKYRK